MPIIPADRGVDEWPRDDDRRDHDTIAPMRSTHGARLKNSHQMTTTTAQTNPPSMA
jgi:hypothetical protein